MNPSAPAGSVRIKYPPGFRPRRGLNWVLLGLLYTSFYLCRYNLSIANKSISDEYGFSRADMGLIITTALLTYAFGQILNGLLTDKLGGKKAMFIGASGTIVMNILFGAVSLLPTQVEPGPTAKVFAHFHLFGGEVVLSLLSFFVVVRGIDGYLQAYGAPGMIKINTAWFAHRERGRFAGIFGFMINLGRFGIFQIGPALLAGFTFLGLWQVPPLHWRWLFWVPAAVCGVVALAMALTVKETPEEAGFLQVRGLVDANETDDNVKVRLADVLLTILSKPVLWITALAYACTGAVRQSVDQWFPRFMEEVHHLDLDSEQFKFLGFLIPFVASTGSLISGYVSDILFKGRRAPVAAGIYFLETAVILLAAQFHSANAAIFFLVLISFTANSTHSLLGTASAMDIGGRKMVGFASGIIDSFQYFGGSLAGYFLGELLDRNWGWYFYFMAPFGLIGGLLMLTILSKATVGAQPLSKTAERATSDE